MTETTSRICDTETCKKPASIAIVWTNEQHFMCPRCAGRLQALGKFMGHGTPKYSARAMTLDEMLGVEKLPTLELLDGTTVEATEDGSVIIQNGYEIIVLNQAERLALTEFLREIVEGND